MIPQTTQKKKVPTYINDNVLESLRSVGTSVGSTLTKDVAGQIGADVLQSLFGTPTQQGELRPNQPIEMPKEHQKEETPHRPTIEMGKSALRSDEVQIKQQIEAVRKELQALSSSVKQMNREIHNAVMETPVDPGVYHLNFFEQLQIVLKTLREQVDDSRSWLMAFNSRKKKMGYWGMMKKHGTTFGLSNERSIATQAG